MAILNNPNSVLGGLLNNIFGDPSPEQGGFRPGVLAMLPPIVASAIDPMNTGRYIAGGGRTMMQRIWLAKQAQENRKFDDLRYDALKHNLEQSKLEAEQQRAATGAAREAWGSFPDQALVTPQVTSPQQLQQNRQAIGQHNWGLLNSVPQQQRAFWEGISQADPVGALKLYGDQATLAANQPPQERWEAFGPDADPYQQGGYGQRNTVTGQISGYQKPPAPEKLEGPLTEIGKLVADRNAGRISPEDFNLGIRGLQAEIAQRMRGPADRAPAGLVNVQTPDGRTRAYRQDDPALDEALSRGAVQVSTAFAGTGGGQPQQWQGVPYRLPQGTQPPATTYIPPDADYTSAVGVPGAFQNAANKALDAIGLDPYFTGNMQATEALNTLELQTRTMLQDALPGRPSNYLMQEFDRLVARPNSPWRGRAGAQTRLTQTRDLLGSTADQLESALRNPGNYTRAQVGQMREKAMQIRGLQRAYDQILERGGMAGATSGEVGGVGWRIVE